MKSYDYDFFVTYAENNGGSCVSEKSEYANLKSRLKFKCGNGHHFDKLASTLVYKQSWCELCSNRDKAHSIEFVRAIIERNGGKLLTSEYKNVRQKLDVICEKGHLWHPRFQNILHNKSWCPFCADEQQISSITTYNKRKIKKKIASNL